MTVPQLLDASMDSLESAASPVPEKTLIILDWDDTLLASSWLSANDLRLDVPSLLEEAHRKELDELQVHVTRLLDRTLELGQVLLVTNAESGWIELSCKKFLPGIVPYLSQVRIVSARSTFESMHPNQPSKWKVQAFHVEIQKLASSHDHANVISVGDSNHEREALHIVTNGLDNLLVKSVKFVERPDLPVLCKQLDLLHAHIEYIVQHSADLDLMISQSMLLGEDNSPANEHIGSVVVSVPPNQQISSGDLVAMGHVNASSHNDDLMEEIENHVELKSTADSQQMSPLVI